MAADEGVDTTSAPGNAWNRESVQRKYGERTTNGSGYPNPTGVILIPLHRVVLDGRSLRAELPGRGR
jgi:hypothetical protein